MNGATTFSSTTIYTDLSPADVAYLHQTAPRDAKKQGIVTSITARAQPNGAMTASIASSAKPPLDFTAGGRPLDEAFFNDALTKLGLTDKTLLWALLSQEGGTPPVGFLNDRRPKILYERHVFSSLTKGRYDGSYPDISGPRYKPGAYGSLASQYDRLNLAMSLDQEAGLQACSWGIVQVLGENARLLGFANAETMVRSMIVSENDQLAASVNYIVQVNAQAELQGLDMTGFAEKYNGPGDVADYAAALAASYERCQASGFPDLRLRSAQMLLTNLHYPLAIDGVSGPHTTAAIASFQRMAGILPADGSLTDVTLDAITRIALP